MKKIQKLSLMLAILLGLTAAILSCEQETDVISRDNALTKTPLKNSGKSKEVILTFKKVSSAAVNKLSLATVKAKRPRLYKNLVLKNNILKESGAYSIYEREGLILLLSKDDAEDPPAVTQLSIVGGYEKVPIDITEGGLILFAICECDEGSDDCTFERDEKGNLGACTGNACGNCMSGFELCAPDLRVHEIIGNFI